MSGSPCVVSQTIAYHVTEMAQSVTEWGDKPTFGIQGVNDSGELVVQLEDVWDDYEQAVQMAELCNKVHLSPVHLQEVIEDYFGAI